MTDNNPKKAMGSWSSQVNALIDELTCGDSLKCQDAREQLVNIGRPMIPYLTGALNTAKGQSRWELVKMLGEIADPSTAEYLTNLLKDKDFDIRWLAIEGLSAIGYDSLKPLLKALVSNENSPSLRNAAHHILHHVARLGYYTLLKPFLMAFDTTYADLEVPVFAEELLERL